MGERLRRFVPRAPRYTLRPQDRNVMRYALANSRGGIEHTTLLNLSETGMAFLMDRSSQIAIGDEIKVEVPVPDNDQIAWIGKVVRIEVYDTSSWFSRNRQEPEMIKVGLRFEALPAGHQKTLRQGIEVSFIRAMREQRQRTLLYYRLLVTQHLWQVVMYVILTVMALGFIYYFTLPDHKYDKDRGTLWGERFKFF